jgi:putative tryptophan/tyrosine transport system substrate-binding protein
MKRRSFITLLGGAAAAIAWPLSPRGQQPPMPVIGFLHSGTAAPFEAQLVAFQQGLKDGGYVVGQNVAIEYRWAEGQYDRLAALAADLVHRQVAAVVTIGGDPSARAAKAATATIPIVFVVGTDPIRSGLVSSLNRPRGDITGVSVLLEESEPKRLGLLRELRATAAMIAVLVNPTNPSAKIQVSDVQEAARSVGQEIDILHAGTIGDINAAFARMAETRADALLVVTDPFFFTRAVQLVVLAARHAIPTLYFRREFAAAGGLVSYGANIDDGYRVLGVYAGRILKGEKPGDLPIQLPTNW